MIYDRLNLIHTGLRGDPHGVVTKKNMLQQTSETKTNETKPSFIDVFIFTQKIQKK